MNGGNIAKLLKVTYDYCMAEIRATEITDEDGNHYQVEFKPFEEKTSALRTRKRASKKLRITFGVLLCLLMIGGISVGLFIKAQESKTPIDRFTEQVPFSLYYPIEMPNGYYHEAESEKYTNGYLFYTVTDGDNVITISEQPKPKQLESFRIDGFSPMAVNVGSMLVGSTNGAPTAIITTTGTLITVTGPKGSDQETVNRIGQNLANVR